MRGFQTFGRGVLLSLLLTGLAVAGIVSGKVTAVSPDGKTVTIETSSGKKSTFKVTDDVKVLVNDKAGEIVVGMTASVFTDSADKPTKIQARTPVEAKPKEAKPEPKPKTTGKAKSTGGDWPGYLGANRDNISQGGGLMKEWPAGGPTKLWTATGVGEGYSTVAVAGGKLFTMGNRDGNQTLTALDPENGQVIWSQAFGKAYNDGTGNGPRGTPTVDGEFVYGLGATGELLCAETMAGHIVWNINVFENYGGSVPGWGVCESVLIDGEKLVCTPGGSKATMVALDKRTGKEIWTCKTPQNDSVGYASIVPIEVGGVRQYVQFTHNATIGVRADDGKFLWRDTGAANGTANCSSIGFFDDMVFSASGYGQGAAMVKLTSKGKETSAKQVYTTKEMKSHHGGFIVLDGYVYGSDEGLFSCLELKTGKRRWFNRDSPGKGSVTCADGMLIVRNEGGPVTLVQASPVGYKQLGKFEQPERSSKPAWAYPVVAQGRLYLRDMDKVLCYDVKGK